MSEKTKTAGEVYKKNIGGVVAVETKGGRQGSGVVVGDNEVVTNCHVIDDGTPVVVLQREDGESRAVNDFPARIIAASSRDLCLLKTDGLSVPAVEIGKSKSLGVGDPAYAIGHPSRIYGTMSGGIVSQIHPNPIGVGEWAGGEIQTTAAISGGSSGGGLFDGEGRLVGITYRSLTPGLHMALPAELVKHLRQRASVEAPLHDELTAALNAPSAEKFRELACRIAESLSHPQAMSLAWRNIGVQEAERGEAKRAATMVESIIALAESLSTPEHRDLVMVDAIHVLANLGGKGSAEDLKSALRHANKLGDKICQVRAYAHIVREWARVNMGEAREVCAKHFPLEKMLKRAEPNTMGEIASTRAALEDSEQALRIANKIPDFGSFVETLARIAYELERQNVSIGSTAIFRFAMDSAVSSDRPVPERLSALAIVAYHAANCGARSETGRALEMMLELQNKHGFGGENYAANLFRKCIISESLALSGKLEGAVHGMLEIPVLGKEIIPALAISAIKMSQMPR